MKKLSLLAIGIFISVTCLAQIWETKELQPQYEVSYTQVNDEMFYRTSFLKCMGNAHLACVNTWWCNSAVEVVLVVGWAIQCKINPETNWNGNIHLTRENY